MSWHQWFLCQNFIVKLCSLGWWVYDKNNHYWCPTLSLTKEFVCVVITVTCPTYLGVITVEHNLGPKPIQLSSAHVTTMQPQGKGKTFPYLNESSTIPRAQCASCPISTLPFKRTMMPPGGQQYLCFCRLPSCKIQPWTSSPVQKMLIKNDCQRSDNQFMHSGEIRWHTWSSQAFIHPGNDQTKAYWALAYQLYHVPSDHSFIPHQPLVVPLLLSSQQT